MTNDLKLSEPRAHRILNPVMPDNLTRRAAALCAINGPVLMLVQRFTPEGRRWDIESCSGHEVALIKKVRSTFRLEAEEVEDFPGLMFLKIGSARATSVTRQKIAHV